MKNSVRQNKLDELDNADLKYFYLWRLFMLLRLLIVLSEVVAFVMLVVSVSHFEVISFTLIFTNLILPLILFVAADLMLFSFANNLLGILESLIRVADCDLEDDDMEETE